MFFFSHFQCNSLHVISNQEKSMGFQLFTNKPFLSANDRRITCIQVISVTFVGSVSGWLTIYFELHYSFLCITIMQCWFESISIMVGNYSSVLVNKSLICRKYCVKFMTQWTIWNWVRYENKTIYLIYKFVD